MRDGLSRFLALLFIEKQFGKPVADGGWMRMALLYASVAARDAPLSKPRPPSKHTSTPPRTGRARVAHPDECGRARGLRGVLRAELAAAGTRPVTLAACARAWQRSADDRVSLLLILLDLPTDTD